MDKNWQAWIERLESDDLTPAELLEFEKLIKSEPSGRDAYLTELMTGVSLEATNLPDPYAGKKSEAKPMRRFYKPLAVAAGLVGLAAISYLCGAVTGVDPDEPTADRSEVFAAVTDADGVTTNPELRIGQLLGKSRINLPDGVEVGIAMRGGARLQLRGPVEMGIESPDRVILYKGRVSTYAPEYAHGFTVDTADGKVIDLGTRFVTAAGTGYGTEVHVLEGLVEAFPGAARSNHNLGQEHAAILKDGKIEKTEFLAQRLHVPLDPVQQDQDGDGFPDSVEVHYGTLVDDATSRPSALRIEEPFTAHSVGPLSGTSDPVADDAKALTWIGAGSFESEGLAFAKGGKTLATSSGSFRTIGENSVGASYYLDSLELAPNGVTYVSFLMRNPVDEFAGCFAGLLLYENDREELFVGKIGTENSYGSRFRLGDVHDAFKIPMDSEPHLFVIRIDRNRLVTDVFFDPVPGESEAQSSYQLRYQQVPAINRIELRSGCSGRIFQSLFDEVRVGLTWESVVPVE